VALAEQQQLEPGGFHLQLERGLPPDRMAAFSKAASASKSGRRNWMFAVLDDALLPPRLAARPRAKGERALVIGRHRAKKLKNLMIDHRIPTSRRAIWPVVVTSGGDYVWSPGLPPAARYARSESSPRLAVLRASPIDAGLVKPPPAFRSFMEKSLQVVKSEEEIQRRIVTLADEIKSSLSTADLMVIGILDDTFVFLADLIRALKMPLSCSFLKVERHRHGGQTEVMFTSETDLRGCDLLLVDGVVATGITLDYITRQMGERGVKSVRSCVLIDKPGDRRVDMKVDFIAFQCDEGYVFGYGLGIQNHYRELPYLAKMS
jgi:hypoxanthine phosphoribosyltransferase